MVLEGTPFYAESGGQVGDTGTLTNDAARFVVTDTQKFGAAFGHVGTLEKGRLAIGDRVQADVDAERRAAIVLNHSATHLLHAALRSVPVVVLTGKDLTKADYARLNGSAQRILRKGAEMGRLVRDVLASLGETAPAA